MTTATAIRCGSCRGRHASVAEVQDCYAQLDDMAAQQAAEVYAEAVMSWVCGGGSPEDASRYASCVSRGETWDGGIGDMKFSGELCDHGMAMELCHGVQHYPVDVEER